PSHAATARTNSETRGWLAAASATSSSTPPVSSRKEAGVIAEAGGGAGHARPVFRVLRRIRGHLRCPLTGAPLRGFAWAGAGRPPPPPRAFTRTPPAPPRE